MSLRAIKIQIIRPSKLSPILEIQRDRKQMSELHPLTVCFHLLTARLSYRASGLSLCEDSQPHCLDPSCALRQHRQEVSLFSVSTLQASLSATILSSSALTCEWLGASCGREHPPAMHPPCPASASHCIHLALHPPRKAGWEVSVHSLLKRKVLEELHNNNNNKIVLSPSHVKPLLPLK